MSRSRNTRKGRKSSRVHSRKGCDFCLHLRRHAVVARAELSEVDDQASVWWERSLWDADDDAYLAELERAA